MNILELVQDQFGLDDENKKKLDAMMSSVNPQIIVLIGLPGSGKSTFINNYRLNRHGIIASTDNIIEEKAKEMGLSYSEAFNKIDFSLIEKQMRDQIIKAGKLRKNIIIDQTNMSNKSRQSKMNLVPSIYDRYAIVFSPDLNTLNKRLEKREKETGKKIPQNVIDSMRSNYVPPSEVEKFKDIIFVK